jgi:hypothetical protein
MDEMKAYQLTRTKFPQKNMITVKLVYKGHQKTSRCLEVPPIKLVLIWDVWGSGWPLLTGGRYSEVVFNTGLTVLIFLKVLTTEIK